MQLPSRLSLAQTPTPLQLFGRLSEAWGGPQIWFKRDDLTGFGFSGNKIRKLEFHLAAAQDAGADVVLTCGGIQSNHCRATALACARLGLSAVLFLRTPDGEPPAEARGNHRLGELAGAEIRYITPDQYGDRDARMGSAAAEFVEAGRSPWVIPEGASDVLGMWGMALAYQEMIDQLVMIDGTVAEVWHTASSAGTTAGFGWAADRAGFLVPGVAVSIGDPVDELQARVEELWSDAVGVTGGTMPQPALSYLGEYISGGYGIVTDEQVEIQAEATRLTGLIFDATYTGKMMFALRSEIRAGRFNDEDHVVVWHTGGGFAALA